MQLYEFEQARLRALAEYGLVDGAPEPLGGEGGAVAWERAMHWLPTFTSTLRGTLVVRGTVFAPHGRDADPLFTLNQMVEMLSRTDFTDGVKRRGLKICGACKADLTECVGKARQHVWNLIPSWFALSDCTTTTATDMTPAPSPVVASS